MRYILDNFGYIEEVTFGGLIECNDKSCTEYIGTIPEGYETLEEWQCNANIRAYKIVDGNLVYDAAKDNELQSLFDKEQYDNSFVTHKELEEIKIDQDDNLKDLYDEQSIENSYFNRLVNLNDCGNLEVEKIDIRANDSTAISNNIKMLFTSANLLPNEISDTSINGITLKQNSDKSINITGTSTSNCEISLAGSPIQVESIFYFLKDINYYLNGLSKNISLKFYKYDGSDRNFIGEYPNESIINWNEDVEVSEIALYIPTGVKVDTTIYPMLQVANETINTYVPYKENSLEMNLGENTFEPGDTIVIEKGEAYLTKDRYIHTGSCFVPDMSVPNYTTLYFNFPDDLYKTLPIEKTDIFICGDDTTGIYVEDKKIYFVTSRYSGERLDVEIYDKENNINLSSCSTYTLWTSDEVDDVISVIDSEVINYISLIPFDEIESTSLGSVKMPSTYSSITNVYSNKDVVSKITYRNSSKLNTNKIVLGTFEINDYGMKSKLTPPMKIANYEYDYTEEDLTKLAEYIVEGEGLTYTEKLLYDLNDDEILNSSDITTMRNLLETGVTFTNPGTLEINSNSPTETIVLKDNEGTKRANINLLGIDAYSFNLIESKGNKTNILEKVYPIGSIYVNVSNGTNPKELFGFGEWEQIQGLNLIGAGTYKDSNNVSKTFNAGDIGGTWDHTHSIPKHNHTLSDNGYAKTFFGATFFYAKDFKTANWTGNAKKSVSGSNSTASTTNAYGTGLGGTTDDKAAFNSSSTYHLTPSLVVYMWKRIA